MRECRSQHTSVRLDTLRLLLAHDATTRPSEESAIADVRSDPMQRAFHLEDAETSETRPVKPPPMQPPLMQMVIKRVFDIAIALVLVLLSLPAQLVIALAIRISSPGPIIFWSDRVGRDNELFRMAKFRTMRNDTPTVATHLLTEPAEWLTPVGAFLRNTSLDELPQLWHVITGKMSLVGPRPALFNQEDLIEMRTELGIESLRPGLTGLAQIMGRDELSLAEKVEFDRQYLETHSLVRDVGLLVKTIAPVLKQESINS